jgi:hypothetical protein
MFTLATVQNHTSAGVDAYAGSKLDIHGTVLGRTWTRLAATAAAGAAALSLKEPVQWAAGSKVVVASTLWKDERLNQNEASILAFGVWCLGFRGLGGWGRWRAFCGGTSALASTGRALGRRPGP